MPYASFHFCSMILTVLLRNGKYAIFCSAVEGVIFSRLPYAKLRSEVAVFLGYIPYLACIVET